MRLLYMAETAETLDEALEILENLKTIITLEKSLRESSGDAVV